MVVYIQWLEYTSSLMNMFLISQFKFILISLGGIK